jgi:hypothetical protein
VGQLVKIHSAFGERIADKRREPSLNVVLQRCCARTVTGDIQNESNSQLATRLTPCWWRLTLPPGLGGHAVSHFSMLPVSEE